ncbi:MAG: DUF4214 domain-containing protein [Acidimicrobiales bacterium]
MARASTPPRSRRTGAAALVAAGLTASAVALVPASPASAGTFQAKARLVSRLGGTGSTTANGLNAGGGGTSPGVTSDIALSGNGRFAAIVTTAKMSPIDTNGKKDVYVRDLWAGTTELASLTDDDKVVLGDSTTPTMSDDGRFVLFMSDANNLIPGDDKGFADVFLRDRYENTTRRISTGISGALLNTPVAGASLSGDGTTTAYYTSANNVVAGDGGSDLDVFVVDNFGGDTTAASVNSSEQFGTGTSDNPVLSYDGRYVAFASTSLLAGGVVGDTNAYVRDRTNGTTEIVSIRSDETLADHGGGGVYMSDDGRYVMFSSDATNMVPNDTNGARDTFVRDRTAGTTQRVSLTAADGQIPEGGSSSSFSGDGKTALFFTSGAPAGTDIGTEFDVYARNITAGTTRRISTGPAIADPDILTTSSSVTNDGTSAAFVNNRKLTGESFDQAYVNGPVSLGPFATSAALVTRQYQDFTGAADPVGKSAQWTSTFDLGKATPAALIAELATADAWAAKRAPLIRLYWAFFLRRPDSGGLTYWLHKYQAGTSLTKIAQSFATSSEFENRYGTVTNAQYVNKVYLNVFKRLPDASGAAYWTKKLDTKALTRGAVIVQFSESSEGKRRLVGPTDITLISLGMYGAVPTAAQWNAVFGPISLGEPQPAAFVAGTFLARSDYAAVVA